ncbi:hypothetical protein NM688_g606 [Phlebia brevispora]|uniref:Uncharacterized protein n=1 Tax=Phlebia brevispora TaxID=194682 RepID=A0ACC1TE81_9APHY|nr:hypothetical protein NM688_g606 [Phlebia brevispora]
MHLYGTWTHDTLGILYLIQRKTATRKLTAEEVRQALEDGASSEPLSRDVFAEPPPSLRSPPRLGACISLRRPGDLSFATISVYAAATMSNPLLALRASVHPFRIAQTLETIRRFLYPPTIRSQASPTGAWRSNVGRRIQRAIPSVQAHETIERAWLLHQRHIRRGRQAELERKYNAMQEAMDTLRKVDKRLYQEANVEEDPRTRTPEEVELSKKLSGQEKKALESRIRGLSRGNYAYLLTRHRVMDGTTSSPQSFSCRRTNAVPCLLKISLRLYFA